MGPLDCGVVVTSDCFTICDAITVETVTVEFRLIVMKIVQW